VTGIDIDVDALQRLEERVKAADMTDRVHIVQGSLKTMDFPAATFDILWAEGSVFVIGFQQALRDWKRFLKPGGYLVLHDAVGDLEQKKREVAAHGYRLIDSFILGSDVWWSEYYEPLGRAVQRIRRQKPADPQLVAALERVEREIQGYWDHPESYRSIYFIMCNAVVGARTASFLVLES
jgi:ubiquinone/menaquinone biosynthesis C-methylase UbiE